MVAVLASQVREKGVPRTAPFLALLASIAAHGALLALIGGDLLHTPSVVRAADVIHLTLHTGTRVPAPVIEPEPPVVKTEPPSPEPKPEPRPRARPQPVTERNTRPGPVTTEPSPRPASSVPSEPAPEPALAVMPAPAAASRSVLRIVPIHNPEPRYPVLARRMGLEGQVVLRVRVTADGQLRSVEVMSGSGHDLLDQAALDAVREWRFQVRGLSDGAQPEALEVPIRFALR